MSTTIEEMNTLMHHIAALRQEEAEASRIKSEIAERLEVAENQMITWLSENNLKNFRSEDGLASVSYRTSVKTPKDPESRAKFFQYLREKGLYESMVTVNSQTLNSFYKEEFALAAEAGNDAFEIPGITEVTINPILSFTRPK